MPWPTTSRHKRGYDNRWDKLRKHILQRDKHLCQPCLRKGRVTSAKEVNHIKPKAQGGTDDEGNLEATCSPCHRDDTARQRGYRVKPRIGVDGWPVS